MRREFHEATEACKIPRDFRSHRLFWHLPRNVDLVIAEGFRSSDYPCIEVYRHGVSLNSICRDDRNLLAVVGDDPGALSIPRFHRDAVCAITELLLRNLSLKHRNYQLDDAIIIERGR